ncbi:TetR/AcrR family transcriptional regulator [Bowmanella denitrificans]|uniref:TetR/AcrR family transcriptional regulator n=1 Tax=Bowmanella denitrificans TaxID=366582 RepID=UPI001C0EE360|nr:TetR/AcrR family transcriptional regulator [Bowmanella denitrificans]
MLSTSVNIIPVLNAKAELMDKRQQLISTAFTLFYQQGIHAVGINLILDTSGIAKKTLYHHFATKEDLLLAVLEYRDSVFRDWLASRLRQAGSGRIASLALFDALDDWFNDRVAVLQPFAGCFFINCCAEFGDVTHPVHRHCARHKADIQALLSELLQQDGMSYQQASAVAARLCLLKEGAIVQAYVCGELEAAKLAKSLAMEIVKGADIN